MHAHMHRCKCLHLEISYPVGIKSPPLGTKFLGVPKHRDSGLGQEGARVKARVKAEVSHYEKPFSRNAKANRSYL